MQTFLDAAAGAAFRSSLRVPCPPPHLLLPLLLQGPEEMTRAVDLALMLADCFGGAVGPAAWLGGVPAGQEPGLRFVSHLRGTPESVVKLGHETGPRLSATRPQRTQES